MYGPPVSAATAERWRLDASLTITVSLQGSGKTLTAKAIANECGCPFLNFEMKDVSNLWVSLPKFNPFARLVPVADTIGYEL